VPCRRIAIRDLHRFPGGDEGQKVWLQFDSRGFNIDGKKHPACGWRYMSDRYVEKTFLYLLLLSVLVHLGVFQLISLIPPEKPKPAQETTIVDLTDLPQPPPEQPRVRTEQPEKRPEVKRYAEKKQRVPREIAPKGEVEHAPPPRPAPPLPGAPRPQVTGPVVRNAEPTVAPEKGATEPVTRGEGIFKPRAAEAPARSRLFPSASRLANLEESYRKKYGPEVEDGEAMFLNTDDIRFGSFLRRLETAVYGVWQYPQEALMRGIEGTTPVRITFNRKGEIVRVELLESSGSGILDNEVMRTLKQIGPVGSFPKGYTKDTFKLIAFFHYGIGGSRLR
jgi:periplasmic protein TonB